MDYLQAIVLGAVQGITEFLPVSSSGHLYIVQWFYRLVPSLALEGWLHLATLLAVVLFFWKDIWNLLQGFFLLIVKKADKEQKEHGVLALKLGIATLCTFALAFVLEAFIDDILTFSLVGMTLIVTAFFIWGSEMIRPKVEKTFVWWMVPVLGIVQAIAILPGISRSGITVALLIALGVNKKESAKISFLLSIPTILGAFVFIALDPDYIVSMNSAWLLSGVVAFLFAVIGIKWMMKWIENKWGYFAWYCLAAGIASLVFNYLPVF